MALVAPLFSLSAISSPTLATPTQQPTPASSSKHCTPETLAALTSALLNYRVHQRGNCGSDPVLEGSSLTFSAAARMLERAPTPRHHAAGLVALAHMLGNTDAVACLRDGRRLKWRQLYVEAVHVDNTFAEAWNHFGWALVNSIRARDGPRQTITLRDGRILTHLDLFIEAIRLDDGLADAYSNLFLHFPTVFSPTSTLTLPKNRVLTRKQIAIEAITRSPDTKYYYHALARSMPVDEYVELDGWPMYPWQLMIEACRCDPDDWTLFDSLRLCLPSTGMRFKLACGLEMNHFNLVLHIRALRQAKMRSQ